MKGMYLTLDSWRPHWNYEGWKQDPDVPESNLSEDKLGGEAEEALVQIIGTTRNGDAAEKGETKWVKVEQCWFSELQFLE